MQKQVKRSVDGGRGSWHGDGVGMATHSRLEGAAPSVVRHERTLDGRARPDCDAAIKVTPRFLKATKWRGLLGGAPSCGAERQVGAVSRSASTQPGCARREDFVNRAGEGKWNGCRVGGDLKGRDLALEDRSDRTVSGRQEEGIGDRGGCGVIDAQDPDEPQWLQDAARDLNATAVAPPQEVRQSGGRQRRKAREARKQRELRLGWPGEKEEEARWRWRYNDCVAAAMARRRARAAVRMQAAVRAWADRGRVKVLKLEYKLQSDNMGKVLTGKQRQAAELRAVLLSAEVTLMEAGRRSGRLPLERSIATATVSDAVDCRGRSIANNGKGIAHEKFCFRELCAASLGREGESQMRAGRRHGRPWKVRLLLGQLARMIA